MIAAARDSDLAAFRDAAALAGDAAATDWGMDWGSTPSRRAAEAPPSPHPQPTLAAPSALAEPEHARPCNRKGGFP